MSSPAGAADAAPTAPVSAEHLEVAWMPLDALTGIRLPEVYRAAIARAAG